MKPLGSCLFDTAIGTCAIAWSERGVAGVQLPERDAEATRARMRRRFPDADETDPPTAVGGAIVAITALINGALRDLDDITLDMQDAAEFPRRVWAVARSIPPGATMTYGEIATQLGDPRLARAVGEAMGRNPFPIVVPCHRVVGAGGKLTGFSANGGIATKLKLLEIEGAKIGEDAPLFGDLPRAVRPQTR